MNARLAALAALLLAPLAPAQNPSPLRVHGSVILPPGFPAGASVGIVARRGNPCAPLAGAALAWTEADANGDFVLELELADPGFFLALDARWLELRPLWIDARTDEASIEVVLAPALRAILHGRFVRAAGAHVPTRSLAGSWVWIEGTELHAAEIDADGEFELCCPAGEKPRTLRARPREFAPLLVDAPALRDGGSTEFVLPLVEPAGLSGRILDSTGNGLAGVTLSLWLGREGRQALALDPWGDVQSVTSDAGGRFEAQGLPSGDLRLYVEDPRWRSAGAQVIGLEPGEQRSDLELVALRAASLRGLVLDESGEPVAGAHVVAGMREGWGGTMVATSDALGRYAFDAALPGEYVIGASAEGRSARPQFVSLAEGGREQAHMLLGRASELVIHVSDLEAPVLVRVTDALGFLCAEQRVWQGELELTLPPGLYHVEVVAHDGAHGAQRIVLTGRESEPVALWM